MPIRRSGRPAQLCLGEGRMAVDEGAPSAGSATFELDEIERQGAETSSTSGRRERRSAESRKTLPGASPAVGKSTGSAARTFSARPCQLV